MTKQIEVLVFSFYSSLSTNGVWEPQFGNYSETTV